MRQPDAQLPFAAVGDAVAELRTEVAERALRSDAKRNLDSILAAADAEFAEHGLEACVADIATRAGVGQATIFRRFATKEDLVLAVVETKLGRMLEAAEAASERKRAWDGLRELMQSGVEFHMRDRALFESAHERVMAAPRLREKKLRMLELVGRVIDRAKAEGDLRRDVAPADVPVLIAAAAQAGAMAGDGDAETWKRYLQIMLDGLRPEGSRSRLRPAPAKSS